MNRPLFFGAKTGNGRLIMRQSGPVTLKIVSDPSHVLVKIAVHPHHALEKNKFSSIFFSLSHGILVVVFMYRGHTQKI